MSKKENEALNAQEQTSKEVDVVQMILDGRRMDAEIASSKKDATPIITAESFFLDNNPRGIMTKATFKSLIQTQSSSSLQELQVFFQRMNEAAIINFKAVTYGKGEIQNFYANIIYQRGKEEFRLPAVDNFMIFMIFYLKGEVKCQFTLKDLYTFINK